VNLCRHKKDFNIRAELNFSKKWYAEGPAGKKIKTFASHSHKNIKLLLCLEFTQNCVRYGVELLMSWRVIFFLPVRCVASVYSKSFLKCGKQ
jgi:hypothetical protein